MSKAERISAEEAAKIMGISPAHVRTLMRNHNINIGFVVAPPKGKKCWKYYIFRQKVNELVGLPPEE